ncbi:MAG: sigma-70 family RNA polymerase sigma factor [Planctomycetota bacterium]
MTPDAPTDADPRAEFGLRLVRELPRLRRHLAARMGQGARLDDAVQEAVLRALQGEARFDRSRAIWPWLRTIANRLHGAGAAGPEVRIEDEPPAKNGRAPGAEQDLETLLGLLPEPERAVIERHYVRGQSVREIASALRLPSGTVRSRMWRARRRLALLAAALAPAAWLMLRPEQPPPARISLTTQNAPLTLETLRLPPPTFSAVDHAADAPLVWSLEGATWADAEPSNED